MIKIIISILFLSMPVYAQAALLFDEASYQNEWCNKWYGKAEYKLPDNTRVDCLTANYAVEFDFAKKWAEAVGQSLHYGLMTGKKPAIILIIEKPKDFEYYNRLKPICNKYGITLWYVKGPFYHTKGKALISL